jgi:hypothetical protein
MRLFLCLEPQCEGTLKYLGPCNVDQRVDMSKRRIKGQAASMLPVSPMVPLHSQQPPEYMGLSLFGSSASDARKLVDVQRKSPESGYMNRPGSGYCVASQCG